MIFDANIEPVCLDTSNSSHDHDEALLTGWGKTRKTGHATKLRELHLSTIPSKNCSEFFDDDAAITENMFCGWKRLDGVTSGDSCQGDSGGRKLKIFGFDFAFRFCDFQDL